MATKDPLHSVVMLETIHNKIVRCGRSLQAKMSSSDYPNNMGTESVEYYHDSLRRLVVSHKYSLPPPLLTLAQHMASVVVGHAILNGDKADASDLVYILRRDFFNRDNPPLDFRGFDFGDTVITTEAVGVAKIKRLAEQRSIHRTNPWTVGNAFVTSLEMAMVQRLALRQTQILRAATGQAEDAENEMSWMIQQINEFR